MATQRQGKVVHVVAAIVGFLFAVTEVVNADIAPDPKNLLAKGKDWPQYMGPTGGCSATPSGYRLATKLSSARLVWKSNELPGGRVSDASDGAGGPISGGLASPVVADGKVFFFYYDPSGTVYDKTVAPTEKWLVEADDVVVCIDAQTGKTMWTRRYERQGINYNKFNKGGSQLTACVYDGKVYAVGTMGKVYCMEAATGKPLWDSDIGLHYDRFVQLKAYCLAQQQCPSVNRDMCSNAQVIGGVVVLNDHRRFKLSWPIDKFDCWDQKGAIAFDANTGDSLWTIRSSLGMHVTPAKWVHDEKEYVILSGGLEASGSTWLNYIRCVEPRTGKVLWKIRGGGGTTPAVGGDYLLTTGDYGTSQVVCFKMTLEGATRAWGVSGDLYYSPAIYKDIAYLRTGSGITALNLANGSAVKSASFGNSDAGYVVIGDNLIMSDNDQTHGSSTTTYLLSAAPALESLDGPLATSPATGYEVAIIPVWVDGRLFIRLYNCIACYDFRSGSSTTSVGQAGFRLAGDTEGIPRSGLFGHGILKRPAMSLIGRLMVTGPRSAATQKSVRVRTPNQ